MGGLALAKIEYSTWLKFGAVLFVILAVVCAVIAYWDKVAEFCGCAGEKLRKKTGCPSEYDDYVEE